MTRPPRGSVEVKGTCARLNRSTMTLRIVSSQCGQRAGSSSSYMAALCQSVGISGSALGIPDAPSSVRGVTSDRHHGQKRASPGNSCEQDGHCSMLILSADGQRGCTWPKRRRDGRPAPIRGAMVVATILPVRRQSIWLDQRCSSSRALVRSTRSSSHRGLKRSRAPSSRTSVARESSTS